MENTNSIYIKGARVHNLKNVSVKIPRKKLIVITGVSGSGKSSLAFDTLFAEGQRKYAESLSAYARQFLNRMEKPDVDYIQGLCPAIAIEQKVTARTPRSTVGSMTEIYDYLKLFYSRIGKTFSPVSGKEVKKHTIDDVLSFINKLKEGVSFYILSKIALHRHRTVKEELEVLLQKGYSRVVIHQKGDKNIEVHAIEDLLQIEEKELGKTIDPTIGNVYLLIDRMLVKIFEEEDIHRITDSASTAFFEGDGELFIYHQAARLEAFNNRFELDDIRFEEPSPNLFSSNNSYGACPVCEGFGSVLGVDKNLVIPDNKLSVFDGAVAPWKGEKLGLWRENFINKASKFNFPIHKPVVELTEKQWKDLWAGNEHVEGINDFFKEVEQNLYKIQYRVLYSRYKGRTDCPECDGYRLRKEALYVKINDAHIGQLQQMPIKNLKEWFQKTEKKLSEHDKKVAKRILLEIHNRLNTLLSVGLNYLTLSRTANTLSGGESQRIQLTRSLGSNLTDSLYILDEPSIGLHSRDTENLIAVLKNLRNLGNTVLVVEHDELMMREADYIIDMGPLASHQGGELVAEGNYEALTANAASLTAKYLTGELAIKPNTNFRKWTQSIQIKGAKENNLKNIQANFPLNVLCVISGVSGSGKTTLIKQVLYPALLKLKNAVVEKEGKYTSISGNLDSISQVEMVDQNPIGKSSRSNPVTYIKAYDSLRDLFAKQPLSKMRGFLPKHFSFNVEGGRCDTCNGEGEQVIEMQFLADVHLTCESCGGKRFKEEVLEVKCREKNIFDVLEMSVDEAIEYFSLPGIGKEEKSVAMALKPLSDVGLGYIKLGQSSSTLSGGEAQRVKLASFLGKGKSANKVLFIFDEPTTGLHFHDINKLLASFHALIEQGHSIIVIEHNIDIIKSADWLIELGPDAGDAGGNIIYEGIPTGIQKVKESFTAKFM